MKSPSVFDCSIIEIDKHHHLKGNLSVVENNKTVNFDVKRVFYLYDVPSGESRGGHAHKETIQMIFATSGSFDIILDDGNIKRTVSLNRPNRALLMPPGIWGQLENFSSGSICLVLTSMEYLAEDYIRDYEEFKQYRSNIG